MEPDVETLVIGAGLSGLMMGCLLKRNYLIVERAPALNFEIGTPFYLHAPLDWLPTRWKEIDVHQHCWDGGRFHRIPDLKMMNDYSFKIVGKIVDTSLKFLDGSVKRGFVPESGNPGQVLRDLYEEVEPKLLLGAKLTALDTKNKAAYISFDKGGGRLVRYKRIISTIPLPALLKMLDMPSPFVFQSDPIVNLFFTVPADKSVDSYQIINVTDPTDPFYRISLMDQKVVAETMDTKEPVNNLIEQAAALAKRLWRLDLDASACKPVVVRPGKFHPIEKTSRKLLLAKLTNELGIYCLGRYAVWDYKRIDHTSQDAHQILKIMKSQEVAQ